MHYIMREFTEFEKECIKSFIDVESTRRVLDVCYIYAQLMGPEVGINFENGTLCYYTDKTNFLPLAQAELKLIDITLLFQYLENTGYLVFTNTENYAGINAPKQKESCKKNLSAEVACLIKHYANCQVYVTSIMIDLVKNNFKSLEEQMLDEAKIQTKRSGIAVALSIVSIIASILLPHLCDKTHIDDIQLNDIKKSIYESSDSIRKTVRNNKIILQIIQDSCFAVDSDSTINIHLSNH